MSNWSKDNLEEKIGTKEKVVEVIREDIKASKVDKEMARDKEGRRGQIEVTHLTCWYKHKNKEENNIRKLLKLF